MFIFIEIQTAKCVPGSTFYDQLNAEYYVLKSTDGSMHIQLKKRPSYPVTFCKWDKDYVSIGYGHPGFERQEYLEIHIWPNGTLTVNRDNFATLPLYYAVEDGRLLIANQYAEIVHALSRPMLSRARLLESLTMRGSRLPLAHGISYLGQNERLYFEEGRLRIDHPPDRSWKINNELPEKNPKEFFQKLNEYFNFFIQTRLKDQQFAFEVSGGLDSATLPQYYELLYKDSDFACSTIYYSQGKDSLQKQKLKDFLQSTGARHHFIEPSAYQAFPFSHLLGPGRYAPHHHAYGGDIQIQYLDMLQDVKPDVLVNGLGGDEMMGNIVDPEDSVEHGEIERTRRNLQPQPGYVTQRFRDAYVAATPVEAQRSIPLLHASVWDPQVATAPYIEAGIWPVTPFADPELFAWCAGLPIQHRANKNILRAYHQAFGFVPAIYKPVKKENFAEYCAQSFKGGYYDQAIYDLAAKSVTAQLGYVDISKLLQMYEHAKQYDYPTVDDDRFTILCWLSAEINVQYSGFVGII